jgi:hypothetical protein
MEVGGHLHTLAALCLGKVPGMHVNMLVGCRASLSVVVKILAPARNEIMVVQHVRV